VLNVKNTFAQQSRIDSLEKLFPEITDEKHKINILNDLCFTYYPIDPKKGAEYGEQAIELAHKMNYDSGLVQAHYYLAVIAWTMGDYETSLNQSDKSIEIAEKNKMYSSVGHCYNLNSLTYQKQGDLLKALEYSKLALEMSKKSKDVTQLSTALSNVGMISWALKDTLNAIQYFEDALDLLDSIHSDPINIASIKANLAGAQPFGPRKKKMIEESIQYNEENGFTNFQAYCYFFLAGYYEKVDSNLRSAIDNYLIAIKYAEESKDQSKKGQTSIHLGVAYKNFNLLDSAQIYLEQGLSITEDLGMDFDVEIGKRNLAEIYAINDQFEKAYSLANESQDLQKQIFNTELANQISFANTEYETEKKEAEIARQQLEIERQNNARKIWIGGAVGSIILISLGFFGWYQRTQRIKAAAELALELEQKRSQDLEQLSALKTTFFNNVSHELRTPLTMVIAPLEDLTQSIKNVNHKKDLDLALSNSKRLLNLTNEILDLSKIEGNKLELNKSEIEVKSFLKRIFHSFDSLGKSRKIDLSFNDTDEEVWINTDSNKLEKVIVNLVGNAIKYSPDESTITLNIDTKKLNDNILCLKIIDNGYGISDEDQQHIFNRFYQSQTLNQSSGTGIGLAIVKEYVDMLDGTISVNSELGKGSTFTIELRNVEVLQGKSEKVHHSIEGQIDSKYVPFSINGNKPRILIVEDDLEMSKYLEGLLSPHYSCEIAYNGHQALDNLNNAQFDLITSDVMMPQMDGFELREKINNHHEWKNIPFILLTARSMEEDKIKGFRLGIDDYITKPFSTSEYIARVHNLLKNKIERSAFEKEETDEDVALDFVKRAEQNVLERIDDSSFSVSDLAAEMNYSNKQLGRILQKHTGLTPVSFILEVRLIKAYQMLKDHVHPTVSEVMYDVGIESASYFTTKFKERFGISPGKL
jgi:signal transduction histidine kinase/DNA-binding response OmpR family regulator